GAPGKIGIGLRESDFRQRLHDFRTGERLRQENHVGVYAPRLRDQPFPEWKRLGVRIVDTKNSYALLAPEQDDIPERFPKRDAVRAGEIGVDDVFVFFWRVLGKANCAIWPESEPFRMLLDPRMIGRTLHREIQGDFHIVFAARCNQAAEVIERAELRMHGIVTAKFVADRIKAA